MKIYGNFEGAHSSQEDWPAPSICTTF